MTITKHILIWISILQYIFSREEIEIADYTYPKREEDPQDIYTICILHTNDIHGTYFPTKIKTPKGGEYEREWIKLDPDAKGFINHYSTSALEEDRAEIYQYLIGCPDEALNNKDEIVQKKVKRIRDFVMKFDKKGIGNPKHNFFANLMDFRTKIVYKEAVFQGNVH